MSESNVRVRRARASRSPVIMEKTLLADFLRMYRSFPCLWDQKHMLYNNKEARDRAYEVLLEKYKLLKESATLVDVKKKIEHMRCAYRREHKKVLMNQFRGRHYKPHLWYFNLLLFLHENEQNEYNLSESMSTNFEDSYKDETQEIEDSDEDGKPKRRKSNTNNNSTNAIYLDDHRNDDDIVLEEVYEEDQEQQPTSYIISNGADAFGRTVGFQLKELDRIQRVYAEKLISDVIFNARLGNLNAESAISGVEVYID